MILGLRYVTDVAKNIRKKKTSTGAVNIIRVFGVVKCGGAVENHRRLPPAANLENTRPRKTTKKSKIKPTRGSC